jgi:hypothetical protein
VRRVGARKSVTYAAWEYSPMGPPIRSRRTTRAPTGLPGAKGLISAEM